MTCDDLFQVVGLLMDYGFLVILKLTWNHGNNVFKCETMLLYSTQKVVFGYKSMLS